MNHSHPQDTHHKALAINLDKRLYGSIAEIGAGQETARWFFRAGGAAGTIAKTISAYDMKFSDAIYGNSPRYVSRERLDAMLSHEYQLVIERLDAYRGESTCFFAFANTVAAHSFSRDTDGHGWLGIRFQTNPREAPSQIYIHVHLHGQKNVQDQETLGILGVNLIYAALYLQQQPEKILASLLDNLYRELLEIDMIDFSGPAFADVDNRVMAVYLVQHGLCDATVFSADGNVTQIAEALWQKAVLVERSRFRPPTNLTINLLDCAQAAFAQDFQLVDEDIFVLSEMTLNNLLEGNDINIDDFLYRADILGALGKNVLISNFGEYYRLAQYLCRYTRLPTAITLGLPSLHEIFNEKYYEHLDGGILESFGRLFKNDMRLYVCPARNATTGNITHLHEFKVAPHLQHLFSYLFENGYLMALDTVNQDYLNIYSHHVLELIQSGTDEWENMVPEEVTTIIKQQRLFNWHGK